MAKAPLTIRNDDELKAALERAEELFGCITDREQEQELAEIAAAIKVYTDAMRVLRNIPADDGTQAPADSGGSDGQSADE